MNIVSYLHLLATAHVLRGGSNVASYNVQSLLEGPSHGKIKV